MAKYMARLQGSNLSMVTGGVQKVREFLTTRFVEADSSTEAGAMAAGVVREEFAGSVRSEVGAPFVVEVQETTEVDSFREYASATLIVPKTAPGRDQ
ncbi:MAG: hypothetical protein P8R42_03130 [Candidatus Binatia bacterium]|nr:hypothetical protein [Candidatus Binatia bacterium]